MNDSQINQQIAISAKRDSSIMMGITVGTLSFLPATAIAVSSQAMAGKEKSGFHWLMTELDALQTIFALPMFDWNAGPNEHVTGPRFKIFLAVALRLTAVTLCLLFVWMSLSDTASARKMTVRAVIYGRLRKLRMPAIKSRSKQAAMKSSPPGP